MFSKRWSVEAVSFAAALFFVAILNIPFWKKLFEIVAPERAYDWGFMAAVFIVLMALTYMAVLLLAVRPLLRPVVGVLLVATAAASYFMLEYGVIIDANMIRNLFETDPAEASDLLTGKFITYVGVLGVLPAVALWFVPIDWPTLRRDFRRKLKSAVIVLPVAAVAAYAVLPELVSTFRGNLVLRLTLTPSNYIGGLERYVSSKYKLNTVAHVEPYGVDARRGPSSSAQATRPVLFVIAVGETARADHFALNGYNRPTNPQLSKVADLVNFSDFSSCGTDTAHSVPCMFSGLGRANFSNNKAESRENLLDVLQRAGFDVIWRENQAGCKGVCVRVKTEALTGLKDTPYFANSENHDEILIDGLPDTIKNLKKDTVIVFHMMGSHGPAYWKRYPQRFETFKPVCRESQFSRCTNEEIVNAYDNTIMYSDYVLSRLIEDLRSGSQSADTGMIYMSDHGESLGENNIYLHGMPYALAPRAQTHVPAVTWLSESMRARMSVDNGCLQHSAKRNLSHDNLFHSVLGILDVQTNVYDSSLDLYAMCRSGKALGATDGVSSKSLH